MSGLINSLLIEPVVRQARRFSANYDESEDPPLDSLSHENVSYSSYFGLNSNSSTGFFDGLWWNTNGPASESSPRPGLFSLNRFYSFPARSRSVDALQDGRERTLQSDRDIFGTATSRPATSHVHPSVSPSLAPPQDGRPGSEAEHEQQRSYGLTFLDNVNYGDDRASQTHSLESNVRRSRQGSNRSDHGTRDDWKIFKNLPSDDGMRILRNRMHEIRQMALSNEEKAKRMHDLMMEDYRAIKIGSPSSLRSPKSSSDEFSLRSLSPISDATSVEHDSHFSVNPDARQPTYCPLSPQDESKGSNATTKKEENEHSQLVLGCKHYERNVKIKCPECQNWYTCHHCHDETEDHELDRKHVKSMLCMVCWQPQPVTDLCKYCEEFVAAYYCEICKLWDDNSKRPVYHCHECGICRRGEGLGKDYTHCKKCNVCVSIPYAASHRCVENATECDCPICSEYMFTSSGTVVAMQCGHYIHRKCYDDLMETSYKCPICNRSAVNMELQWRKLDQAIEAQPMPSQFSETKVWVTCNDCAAKTCTKYHWLANKCTSCDSYNTNIIKMVNTPSDQELEAVAAGNEARALHAAEQAIADANRTADVEHIADLRASDALQDNDHAQSSQVHTRDRSISPPSESLAEQRNSDPNPIQSPSQQTSSIPTDPVVVEQPSAPSHISNVELEDTPSNSSPSHISFQATDSHSHDNGAGYFDDSDALQIDSSNEGSGEDEEDDVQFWGEAISPGSWSIPSMPNMPNMPNMPSMPNMSISPMSGWTSPSFFATRMMAERGAGDPDESDGEGDYDEDEGESSDGESEGDDLDGVNVEGEGEEDADVDEFELFGHR